MALNPSDLQEFAEMIGVSDVDMHYSELQQASMVLQAFGLDYRKTRAEKIYEQGLEKDGLLERMAGAHMTVEAWSQGERDIMIDERRTLSFTRHGEYVAEALKGYLEEQLKLLSLSSEKIH